MKKNILTYYSTQIYSFIKKEIIKLRNYFDNKVDDINSNIDTINSKVKDNSDNIIKNTEDIQANFVTIGEVKDKVDIIQDKADNGEFDTKVNGNIININNVEQHVFKNIKSGESIEIPNTGVGTDFLIECYEQIEEGTPLLVRSIEVNENTKDLFEYDERYVTIDENGARPKNSVEIPLELMSVQDGLNIYISKDTLPIELVESIDNITDYEIKEKD